MPMQDDTRLGYVLSGTFRPSWGEWSIRFAWSWYPILVRINSSILHSLDGLTIVRPNLIRKIARDSMRFVYLNSGFEKGSQGTEQVWSPMVWSWQEVLNCVLVNVNWSYVWAQITFAPEVINSQGNSEGYLRSEWITSFLVSRIYKLWAFTRYIIIETLIYWRKISKKIFLHDILENDWPDNG